MKINKIQRIKQHLVKQLDLKDQIQECCDIKEEDIDEREDEHDE